MTLTGCRREIVQPLDLVGAEFDTVRGNVLLDPTHATGSGDGRDIVAPGEQPGSLVSQGPDADSAADTWPVMAAAIAEVELVNLSLAGNAHLDPFVARTIRDTRVGLISLKLGLNVVTGASFRRRSFGPAVHGFLDTIREGHPTTPMLVISPLICPPVEDTPGPTALDARGRFMSLGRYEDVPRGALTLKAVREELRRIVASRRSVDANLHYLDGRNLLGLDDVPDLPDGLHPNTAGHRRIAERFAEIAFTAPGPFSTSGSSSHRMIAFRPAARRDAPNPPKAGRAGRSRLPRSSQSPR